MEPKERIELSSFPYQRNILPLNYFGWSFAADSNRAFLVTSEGCRYLHLRSKSGAESGNQTRLAGLEDQSLISRPTPLKIYFYVKERMVGDLRIELRFYCSQDNRITTFPIPEKSKSPILFREPGRFALDA